MIYSAKSKVLYMDAHNNTYVIVVPTEKIEEAVSCATKVIREISHDAKLYRIETSDRVITLGNDNITI